MDKYIRRKGPGLQRPLRMLLILLLLVAGASELYAQRIPAWTRHLTPHSWKNLTRGVSFRPTARAPFTRSIRPISSGKPVKTTDRKFIYHHVNYSAVFSKAEKEMLLTPIYPQATLGRIAYLHDKHAAFFSTIVTKDTSVLSETAFSRHQDILGSLFTGLENYYLQNIREKLASNVFSVEEIARLQTQAQPSAYLLSPRELTFFSQLPSLDAQKEWVSHMIASLEQQVQSLLTKDTFTLKATEFESYYLQNRRLGYFNSLAGVLDRATAKRPSAIIRYKRPLPIPGETTLLTDAQRAGYLQFMADTTHNPIFAKYIEQFNQDYGPYAVAEALEVPYEVPLSAYMYTPELLGNEEGARLRQLSPHRCLAELTPKILELDTQLETLRQAPANMPAFYTVYYRVYATQQIYKTLTARANAIIELENFRR